MKDRSKARRRSAGEGSVYFVPARNRWVGALSWTEPDGSRRRRVVSGRTSAEARDALDALRRELRSGTLTDGSRRLTVAEWLTSWLERDRSRVRPSTHRGRDMHVRVYLIPALGRIPLHRLTAADVERALQSFMAAGRPTSRSNRGRPTRAISAQSARHIRATLRRALNEAGKAGLVGRNAASDAAPPRLDHRPVAYLSAADIRRLHDATEAHEHGPLYRLLVSTGLRQGEALALRWSDMEDGTLAVRRSLSMTADGGYADAEPKSAKSRRTIPLPRQAREALDTQTTRAAAMRERAGSDWQDTVGRIFTDAIGRPLSPHLVSTEFQRQRRAAGIPKVRLHDLRHSAATLLLAEGVPLAVISDWLGHAGIAVTMQHYAAVVPELRHEAAEAMDRALA